jgi:adenine phosphoribosyltransferase
MNKSFNKEIPIGIILYNSLTKIKNSQLLVSQIKHTPTLLHFSHITLVRAITTVRVHEWNVRSDQGHNDIKLSCFYHCRTLRRSYHHNQMSMQNTGENTEQWIEQIKRCITTVYNFPKDGILFRDISPLLNNPEKRELAFDMLAKHYLAQKIDAICGIDARGFIFATALAQRLNCPMIMIRKANKMPNTISERYDLEYGTAQLEIQKDVLAGKKNILIVDDLLATGGTMIAACNLVEKAGGNLYGVCCLIELEGLNGRNKIKNNWKNVDIFCPIVFSAYEKVNSPEKKDLKIVKQTIYLPLKPIPGVNDERVIVFAHPSMESLADQICNTYSTQFRRGAIRWGKFPDGYFDIHFEHMDGLEGKNAVFLGSLYDPSKLLEQLSMMMVLPRQQIQSLNIVVPYFGPATMERVEEEGTLATAETTAKILTACMPMTRSGPATLRIFDIHALPVRFYFTDNVVMKMMSSIPLLTDFLKRNYKVTIAFPDEGAFKRFKMNFADFPIIVCSKVRDGDKRYIKIIDRLNWSFDDSQCMEHVLIVDDLVQSGGTLDECRKALINLGAKKVSAFVVHPVFPNEGYRRFMKGGDREGFEHFFVTNTIPEVANKIKNVAPFHIFELHEVLADSILKQLKLPRHKSLAIIRTIFVASNKETELQATWRAFSRSKRDGSRFNVKVFSTVMDIQEDKQLLSTEEIEKESSNYLNALISQSVLPKDNSDGEVYYIAISGGLVFENSAWVEKHCIKLLKSGQSNIRTCWSDPIIFPKEYSDIIHEVVQEQKGNVIVGSLLEKKLGVKEETWRDTICENDYISLLQKAIEEII